MPRPDLFVGGALSAKGFAKVEYFLSARVWLCDTEGADIKGAGLIWTGWGWA